MELIEFIILLELKQILDLDCLNHLISGSIFK